MDDDVDEELVGWPTSSTSTSTSKKSKKRKSDAGRSLTRERSTSTRAASAETVQRGESRAAEGPGPEQKDDVSDQDDDDAESDGADGEALAEDEFSRQQAIYAAQQRNMGLLSHLMDDEQLERHMASRRGTLNKGSVRKLVNHVLAQSVNQHIVMTASGVGKVFVGEMVEQARAVQRERNESGPIQPVHLYEAYRRYKLAQERPGHFPPGMTSGAPGLGRRRRLF
ncbi:transcription factor TFIID complex protein [Malassezia pachydermatis]